MRVERLRLRLLSSHAGLRLDDVLGKWLPSSLGRMLSRSAVRRLVMAGAIQLNGRAVRRPGLLVEAGQVLEARIDTARLSAPAAGGGSDGAVAEHPADGPAIRILFEDRWLLAVFKPAGLQVHASADPARPDLFTVVRRCLAARAGGDAAVSGEPYLALHHRLDIETSGVVLFAIDAAANAGLSRAFVEHRVEKVYEAITGRPQAVPREAWTARGPLALTGTGRSARVRVVRGGQRAETWCTILRRFPSALLVEARPATGRKHQVRAHLADAGLAVLGDPRYGGAVSAAGIPVARVMLHAAALRLTHPVTGDPLDIRCPRPRDFQGLLERLERRRRPSLDTPSASR